MKARLYAFDPDLGFMPDGPSGISLGSFSVDVAVAREFKRMDDEIAALTAAKKAPMRSRGTR